MKAIIVFLVMITTDVYPQELVWGVGKNSCGSYINAAAEVGSRPLGTIFGYNELGLYEQWFQGLASGFAVHSHRDVFKKTDSRGIFLWLENYCRKHPLDNFYTASIKVIKAIDSAE
jgi:hypothetical protein